MDEPRVLFLADRFSDASRDPLHSHPGGAELTDAAALEASPWPVETARAGHFHPEHLADFDLHVVANCSEASDELLAGLQSHGRHVLFEHDVRICEWRGNFAAATEPIHRHARRCICRRPAIEELFETALGAVFLTHRQLQCYLDNPFFVPPRHEVLGSSLMDEDFLERSRRGLDSDGGRSIEAAILGSEQFIKGTEDARDFCRERGVEPYVLRDLEPAEVLDVFERTQTLVYLPTGLEPAGRMPVEARFLGCDVIANGFTGVVGESWWNLPDERALDVLADAPDRFWRIVDRFRRHDGDAPEPAPSLPEALLDALANPAPLAHSIAKPVHIVRNVLRDRVADLRRPRVATDDETVFFG